MWGRYHLEESARLLAAEPDAIACINMAVIVADSSRGITAPHSTLIQAGASPWADRFADYWVWTARDVLVSSLLWTPLNMWAAVGRRAPLTEALRSFVDPEQGTDLDRYMLWRLSLLGPIVIGREVGLFYRIHAGSSCSTYEAIDPDFHRRSWRRNVESMLDEAAAHGIDARKEWLDSVGRDRLPWVRSITGPLPSECRAVLVERWGADCGLADAPPQRPGARHFLRQCLPPIVLSAVRRLSHALSRG